MDFRSRVGDERFADVAFADLQVDPVGALGAALDHIGIGFPATSHAAVTNWATGHQPGSHGQHSYDLADFGLDADQVRRRFAPYIETYDAVA
jgi:hypothetical protein